jgi:hypothetical protein
MIYKGINLQLIHRGYGDRKARRFVLIPPEGATNVLKNQNVWIPLKHLNENDELLPHQDIDYVFRKAQHQLELAGYHEPIIGIKRRTSR